MVRQTLRKRRHHDNRSRHQRGGTQKCGMIPLVKEPTCPQHVDVNSYKCPCNVVSQSMDQMKGGQKAKGRKRSKGSSSETRRFSQLVDRLGKKKRVSHKDVVTLRIQFHNMKQELSHFCRAAGGSYHAKNNSCLLQADQKMKELKGKADVDSSAPDVASDAIAHEKPEVVTFTCNSA